MASVWDMCDQFVCGGCTLKSGVDRSRGETRQREMSKCELPLLISTSHSGSIHLHQNGKIIMEKENRTTAGGGEAEEME